MSGAEHGHAVLRELRAEGERGREEELGLVDLAHGDVDLTPGRDDVGPAIDVVVEAAGARDGDFELVEVEAAGRRKSGPGSRARRRAPRGTRRERLVAGDDEPARRFRVPKAAVDVERGALTVLEPRLGEREALERGAQADAIDLGDPLGRERGEHRVDDRRARSSRRSIENESFVTLMFSLRRSDPVDRARVEDVPAEVARRSDQRFGETGRRW